MHRFCMNFAQARCHWRARRRSLALAIGLMVIATGICSGAEQAGTVQRTEVTPDELRDVSITYERLAFTFPEPVLGHFWIEFRRGKAGPQKQDVPRDAVPAATRFNLAYVHLEGDSAFVSVTTDHDGRADRRTGSIGHSMEGGTRTVSYSPVSEKVPLGMDIELFSAERKPSWRRPKDPTLHYRIMAHFKAPN
jgi:hypothetical protein